MMTLMASPKTTKKPATLTFDYRNTTADPSSPGYIPGTLTAAWLNPSQSLWISIGGTDDPAHKQLTVSLGHFSYYALAK